MARKRHLFSTAIQSVLIAGSLFLSGSGFENQSRVEQAGRAYQEGRYEEVIEQLEPLVPELATQPLQQAGMLLNLSVAYQEVGAWGKAEAAIAQAEQLLSTNPHPELLASLHETQGKLHFSLGRYAEAFRAWEQAADAWAQLGKTPAQHRVQLHQIRALEKLGQYRSAMKRLVPLYQAVQAPSYDHTPFKAQVYLQLITVGRVVGEFPTALGLEPVSDQESRPDYLVQALALLQTVEAIAPTGANPQLQTETRLALGDLHKALYYWAKDSQERVSVPATSPQIQRQYFDQAMAAYQTVAQSDSALATQAQLNLVNLAVDVFLSPPLDPTTGITIADPVDFVSAAPQIAASLRNQPPNRDRFFAQINLAQRLLNYHHHHRQLSSQAVLIEQMLLDTLRAVNPELKQFLRINIPVHDRDGALRLSPNSTLHNALNHDPVCSGNFRQTADPLVTAYSLVYLGTLYEKQEQIASAQACTEAALLLAEPLHDDRLMYQVQWQLGRLLARSPKTHRQAIQMYESTIDTLDQIRADLVSLKQSEFRFSFRNEVEPVYRQLMSLLLRSETAIAVQNSGDFIATKTEHTVGEGFKPSLTAQSSSEKAVKSNLDRVTGVLEELQVATIEDYLRCDLSSVNKTSAEAIAKADKDNKTAFIYPIYNQGRIEIVLKYYQGGKKVVKRRSSTAIKQIELNEKLTILRDDIAEDLTPRSSSIFKEVYDLLIRPIEADLQAHSPEILVFALDRFFQNIPLAALHDGEKYLVEDYAIALNLGLPLYENSQIPSPENLEILVAGTTTDFAVDLGDLPQVRFELDTIQRLFPNQVDVLAEADFVSNQIKDAISAKPFSVVHLATHGQFGSNPQDTFIVTRDAKLDLDYMTQILHQRAAKVEDAIQLLVLSACQTAAGDRRAALGLAGITVQTGARSAIASLQLVGDTSTAILMSELYQQFAQGNTSRAQALRQAQLAMLKRSDDGRRPNAWATFILIGSWQ